MSDHSRPVTGYPAYPTTAYPPQPQPTYFHVTPNPYASRPRATFVHRFFAFLIGCILITGIIVFIIWLVLRPQIPQFRVQTLTLTHFNLSSTSLISGNWDLGFVARNPNSKITLYYDEIGAAVYYKSDSISETTVPPFVQGTRNESALKAMFASVNAYVDGRDGINEERSQGTVSFNLRMVTRVRFQAGSWWARRRVLRVYCPDLSVRVNANGNNGSLVGGLKQCSVGL
ncbi:NDR1/HIN1-like protein 10 [Bidens hawaiensis]|uniref:NDR1/HIN1-like protein 10 n=1 Tax=Bidens hawaiensis TaxID=980011 RepID=UPI0040491105